MSQLSVSSRLLIPLALVCLHADPAAAQRLTGPYAGLFGGAAEQEDTAESLQVRGSLFGAWDDVVVTGRDSSGLDRRLLAGSTGAGAHGEASYSRRGTAVQFSAAGASDVRLYRGAADLTAFGHDANAALTATLGTRVTLNARGFGSYSSFYQFAPFLGAGVEGVGPLMPGFGFASAAERNARLGVEGGLTITTSRRSSVSLDASASEQRFLDRPEYTLDDRRGAGRFQYQLTRALGVHAGYAHHEGRYHFSGSAPVAMQTIDVGIDYRDTLAFARRTALSFGSSTSALRIDDETHYRVNGTLTLSRGLRRTWVASTGYTRDTGFVAGFRAPVLSDSINAAVDGLLSRRTRWAAGAGLSRSTVGFASGSAFWTSAGTTRLEFALTRRLAMYGQYAYYRYNVPAGSTAGELVPQFARHAATAGVTLWVPVINERGTPRDTR